MVFKVAVQLLRLSRNLALQCIDLLRVLIAMVLKLGLKTVLFRQELLNLTFQCKNTIRQMSWSMGG